MVLYLTSARPYAKALFSEAKETNQLTSWLGVLRSLSKIIKNKSIVPTINSPNISDEKIKSVLLELLREIEPETNNIPKNKLENFLQLLMNEKRLTALPDITSFYHKLLNGDQGITEVKVISAFSLSNNQKEQIKKKLERRFGATVKLKVLTDKSLVGGAIIYAGNWVLDDSIKSKLTRLAKKFKEVMFYDKAITSNRN